MCDGKEGFQEKGNDRSGIEPVACGRGGKCRAGRGHAGAGVASRSGGICARGDVLPAEAPVYMEGHRVAVGQGAGA